MVRLPRPYRLTVTCLPVLAWLSMQAGPAAAQGPATAAAATASAGTTAVASLDATAREAFLATAKIVTYATRAIFGASPKPSHNVAS